MRNFTDLPTTGQNVAEYINERGIEAQFLNDNDKIYGRDGGVYKNRSWISNEDLRLVNYDYGKPGTTSNCCKCSAALELRRRGINVTAGRQTQGSLTTALQYWFDGAVEYKEHSDTLETRIKKGGRRSTGALDFRYPNGAGGHSMYVQVQNDGEPRYYDGQIGRSFSSLDDVYNFYGFDRNATAKYTRLDNATPNYRHMSEDSVLRIDFTDKSHNGVYNEKEKRMVDTW